MEEKTPTMEDDVLFMVKVNGRSDEIEIRMKDLIGNGENEVMVCSWLSKSILGESSNSS